MLASLGAAAGALASNAASASVVVQSVGRSGGEIGGSPTQLLIPLTGGASLSFSVRGGFIAGPALTTSVFGQNTNFLFEEQAYSSVPVAQPLAKGTRFDVGSGTPSAMIDIRSSGGGTFGPNPSGLQYFNFLFQTASGFDTGWFSGSYHNNSMFSVYFTVQSVAYDTTPNEYLGAGEPSNVASSSVPEPASLGLLALAAMATGAAATRRYKRARRDA